MGKYRNILEVILFTLMFLLLIFLLSLFVKNVIGTEPFLGGLSLIFATVSIIYFLNPKDAPEMVLRLEPRPEYINFINLEIANLGKATAYNIRFEIINLEKVPNPINNLFRDLNILKEKIPHMKPDGQYSFFILSIPKEFDFEWELVVKILYENVEGKGYETKSYLTLKHLKGISQLGDGPPIYQISTNIKEIKEILKEFIHPFNPKLKVVTYTKKEIDAKKKSK